MNIFFYFLIFILFPFIAQSQIKLQKITPEISNLWGIAILDEDEILVTQRSGNLYRLNVFNKNLIKIEGNPNVYNSGQGGLLDIAFEKENNVNRVYLCLSKVITNNKSSTAIHSYNLIKDKLTNEKVIFISNKISPSGRHFGCRLVIKNKYIFATLGDRGARQDSQNSKNHSGTIIKILKNGNAYNNEAFTNSLPEIYSLGHRNPQGLSFNLTKNILWAHEHGPQGGDELNIVLKGKNYGWPKVTFGKEYGSGKKIGMATTLPGYEDPKYVWIPSIAPSGMIFYRGNMFPEFKNKIILGSLKYKRLHILTLKNNSVVKEEIFLENKIGRIRDIEEISDGSLIIINDEYNGGAYRLFK